MSKVNVNFSFEPEDEEADDADPSGLTSEAFEQLMEQLSELGATDVRVEKRA